MAGEPRPEDVYDRARGEGERRLSMTALEQASTGFIAGVTIVFGIVALGVTRELVAPDYASGIGQLIGALAFGIGLVFVVVGRTELFTENFFDPVAAAVARRRASAVGQLARLWLLVLLLNFAGGAVMAAVFVVRGTLPAGAHETLALVAEEIAAKEGLATFTRGIAAGTLLTLLSYLLHAVGSAGSRIALAYVVGFFLALGPFDHVVVSGLHLLFGIWLDAHVSYADLGLNVLLAGAGNLVGGLLLMTLTHAVQARGAAR
ncbi:formate/nitrite transporter family protein [Micromonospora halophytica]|uniref:Formate/nitrite transporter FocA, FNT family n=1 Tax=Micromonospora halophytica TaxID=47864 RepID=A0A1C5IQ56_9ACTN|nr:formate/nitrite transporter family protein [Micromonospora halophytica]SCG60283.1 Formate/nitrite transporter FocA, FNT family [Micromonospora halophytica]